MFGAFSKWNIGENWGGGFRGLSPPKSVTLIPF